MNNEISPATPSIQPVTTTILPVIDPAMPNNPSDKPVDLLQKLKDSKRPTEKKGYEDWERILDPHLKEVFENEELTKIFIETKIQLQHLSAHEVKQWESILQTRLTFPACKYRTHFLSQLIYFFSNDADKLEEYGKQLVNELTKNNQLGTDLDVITELALVNYYTLAANKAAANPDKMLSAINNAIIHSINAYDACRKEPQTPLKAEALEALEALKEQANIGNLIKIQKGLLFNLKQDDLDKLDEELNLAFSPLTKAASLLEKAHYREIIRICKKRLRLEPDNIAYIEHLIFSAYNIAAFELEGHEEAKELIIKYGSYLEKLINYTGEKLDPVKQQALFFYYYIKAEKETRFSYRADYLWEARNYKIEYLKAIQLEHPSDVQSHKGDLEVIEADYVRAALEAADQFFDEENYKKALKYNKFASKADPENFEIILQNLRIQARLENRKKVVEISKQLWEKLIQKDAYPPEFAAKAVKTIFPALAEVRCMDPVAEKYIEGYLLLQSDMDLKISDEDYLYISEYWWNRVDIASSIEERNEVIKKAIGCQIGFIENLKKNNDEIEFSKKISQFFKIEFGKIEKHLSESVAEKGQLDIGPITSRIAKAVTYIINPDIKKSKLQPDILEKCSVLQTLRYILTSESALQDVSLIEWKEKSETNNPEYLLALLQESMVHEAKRAVEFYHAKLEALLHKKGGLRKYVETKVGWLPWRWYWIFRNYYLFKADGSCGLELKKVFLTKAKQCQDELQKILSNEIIVSNIARYIGNRIEALSSTETELLEQIRFFLLRNPPYIALLLMMTLTMMQNLVVFERILNGLRNIPEIFSRRNSTTANNLTRALSPIIPSLKINSSIWSSDDISLTLDEKTQGEEKVTVDIGDDLVGDLTKSKLWEVLKKVLEEKMGSVTSEYDGIGIQINDKGKWGSSFVEYEELAIKLKEAIRLEKTFLLSLLQEKQKAFEQEEIVQKIGELKALNDGFKAILEPNSKVLGQKENLLSEEGRFLKEMLKRQDDLNTKITSLQKLKQSGQSGRPKQLIKTADNIIKTIKESEDELRFLEELNLAEFKNQLSEFSSQHKKIKPELEPEVPQNINHDPEEKSAFVLRKNLNTLIEQFIGLKGNLQIYIKNHVENLSRHHPLRKEIEPQIRKTFEDLRELEQRITKLESEHENAGSETEFTNIQNEINNHKTKFDTWQKKVNQPYKKPPTKRINKTNPSKTKKGTDNNNNAPATVLTVNPTPVTKSSSQPDKIQSSPQLAVALKAVETMRKALNSIDQQEKDTQLWNAIQQVGEPQSEALYKFIMLAALAKESMSLLNALSQLRKTNKASTFYASWSNVQLTQAFCEYFMYQIVYGQQDNKLVFDEDQRSVIYASGEHFVTVFSPILEKLKLEGAKADLVQTDFSKLNSVSVEKLPQTEFSKEDRLSNIVKLGRLLETLGKVAVLQKENNQPLLSALMYLCSVLGKHIDELIKLLPEQDKEKIINQLPRCSSLSPGGSTSVYQNCLEFMQFRSLIKEPDARALIEYAKSIGPVVDFCNKQLTPSCGGYHLWSSPLSLWNKPPESSSKDEQNAGTQPNPQEEMLVNRFSLIPL